VQSSTMQNMKQKLYIIVLLAVGMIAATGCANKKKIARQQEAELRRQQDSIALVQKQQEELARAEKEALEIQRRQDSIEAAQKAMVQTMYIPRMTVTAVVQGKQITTPATLRWQRNTAMALSIQPMAGIEMFRIEANGENVIIIDKLNRRYTRLSYNDLAKMGVTMSLEELDSWIDNHILAHRDEPQLTMQVTRAGMSGSAVIYTNTIQTDGKVNMRPTNVETYRQVSLQQLVSEI